ncbi:MAG: hypothetical protein QM758_25910 [Armatimonas sp.]
MPNIAERLQQSRKRPLAGRDHELSLFEAAISAPELPFVVLSLFGPGGVGKTALLRAYAEFCQSGNIPCRVLDGRLLEPTPMSVGTALRGVGESGGREVVILDGFDYIAPLEGWFHSVYLPNHTGDTLFVLAGRRPLSAAWRTDNDWQELLHTLPLRNLPPDAARQYLADRGIADEELDAALRLTHGYPLALVLVAELAQQRVSLTLGMEPPPDVVQVLLERFIEGVPSSEHRAALEVCALLRVTTEPTLARILDRDDAHDLFDWLRSLSFIEPGHPGVYPQEVAREALLADLRWRSPDRYAELHRRARAVYKEGLAQGGESEQLRILLDYIFLHRENPLIRQSFTWQETQSAYADRWRPTDYDALREMTAQLEGEASAEQFSRWWQHPAMSCTVYRQAGPDSTPLGFLLGLALERITDEEAAADEAVVKAKAYLENVAPLRTGETATLWRFWMARDTYHGISPVQSLILVSCVRYYLTTAGLAYSFFPVLDAKVWGPALNYAEFVRVESADYAIGDRTACTFAHDWRVQPSPLWLDALAEKELAGHAAQVATSARPVAVPTLLVLSQEDFAQAVREGLKRLARGGDLMQSPLLRSRVVGERVRGTEAGLVDRASALKSLLRETIAGLEGHPRRDRAYRALLHTILRPAPSQEKAAEILDLPFSTYRRHLGEGVELVVQALWQQEIGNVLK